MSGDPEKFNNWTAQIRKAQLWLQQRLGLSLSLVAGVMLGSQMAETDLPGFVSRVRPLIDPPAEQPQTRRKRARR
jgi:hypothetical protein